jgi:hypothetical protein
VAAVDAITEMLGEDALVAVILARDGGYSVYQILEAAETGALTAEGTVPGVKPAQTAYRLIEADASRTGAPAANRTWAMSRRRELSTDEFPISAEAFVESVGQSVDRLLDARRLASERAEGRREREQSEQGPERNRRGAGALASILSPQVVGYSWQQIVEASFSGRSPCSARTQAARMSASAWPNAGRTAAGLRSSPPPIP